MSDAWKDDERVDRLIDHLDDNVLEHMHLFYDGLKLALDRNDAAVLRRAAWTIAQPLEGDTIERARMRLDVQAELNRMADELEGK